MIKHLIIALLNNKCKLIKKIKEKEENLFKNKFYQLKIQCCKINHLKIYILNYYIIKEIILKLEKL